MKIAVLVMGLLVSVAPVGAREIGIRNNIQILQNYSATYCLDEEGFGDWRNNNADTSEALSYRKKIGSACKPRYYVDSKGDKKPIPAEEMTLTKDGMMALGPIDFKDGEVFQENCTFSKVTANKISGRCTWIGKDQPGEDGFPGVKNGQVTPRVFQLRYDRGELTVTRWPVN